MYMTDTDYLAHGFLVGLVRSIFLPRLRGNERILVGFLSWPYELTKAKTFFKNLLLVSTRFPFV